MNKSYICHAAYIYMCACVTTSL